MIRIYIIVKIDDITLIIQYTGLTTTNETLDETAWDFIESFLVP